MCKRIFASLALLIGLLQAVPTVASVIYTSRTSSLSLAQCSGPGPSCTTQTQSVSDFSPLSATLTASGGDSSSVSQTSQLTDNSISVNLSAIKTWVDFDSTSFKVDFTLDTTTNITFSCFNSFFDGGTSSSIQLTGPAGGVFGIADVTMGMSGPYTTFTYSNDNFYSPYPPSYSTKSLAPGAYELYMTAAGYGQPYMGYPTSGDANFTLSFAPVPIPAAGWLLSSALAGLAWLARQRKKPWP